MAGSRKSFFVTGGTLRPDAACYVERRADREIFEGLLTGDFCYVLTSRQMGKSSLMVRTVQRLRADGRAVAVLDLTAIGQNLSVEQWYKGLLERLGQQLGVEDAMDDFQAAHQHLSPVQRWFAALREVVLHDEDAAKELVIFIDEIDAVRSLPFSTDEFFAAIRECYNRRSAEPALERLTFCLLGVATPSDLIRDTRTTPFNIGRRIELRDFSPEESRAMLGGFSDRFGDELAERMLARVQHWTNGQPYLTQLFCRTLVERDEVRSLRKVDKVCAELFLTEQAAEKNDNLVFVRERLLRSEVDRFELLQLYARVLNGGRVADDPSNPLVCVLRLAGVTREERGWLAVRSPIYRRVFDCRWVRENLPDAELRRQQRAYWRGVVRAAVWASVGLAVIATLWIDARFQAIRADLSAARELEQRLIAVRAEQEAVAAERHLRVVLGQMELRQAEEMFGGGRSPMALAFLAHLLRNDPNNEIAAQRLIYALSQKSFALPLESENVPVHFPRPSQELRLEKAENGLEVAVYRRGDNELVATLKHDALVRSEQLSPDGLTVATACFDDTVRLWDARTGRPLLPPLRHDGPVLNAAFSPEGLRVVSSSVDRAARVWDVATGDLLVEPILHERAGFEAEFSADGTRIVTRSRLGRSRTRTAVWDIRARGLQALPLPHKQSVRFARLSPDGEWLLSGSGGNHLRVWRIRDGALLRDLETDRAVTAFAFSRSSDGFLCGTASGSVTWHSLPEADRSEPWLAASGAITSIDFSVDGTKLLIADAAGGLRLLNATNRETILEKSLNQEISKATMSKAGDRFLTVTTDRVVRVWSAADGEQLFGDIGHFGPIVDAAIGPQGRRVVTLSRGFSGRATLWDYTSEKREIPLEHNSAVVSVEFDPQGTSVATGSWDRSARIWDVATGEVLGGQMLHDGPVAEVTFFRDGLQLVTATTTHLGRIWNAMGGQPLSEVFRAPHTHHYTGSPFARSTSGLVSLGDRGLRFAMASDEKTMRVWATLNPPLPVPSWLPDLAEAIGGQRVNTRGSVAAVDRREFFQLRRQIGDPPPGPFYAEWLKWLLADRDQRAIAPGDVTSFGSMIERLLLDGTPDQVREAARLAPTNPDVLDKLADTIAAAEEPNAETRVAHLRAAAQRYRELMRK